MRVQPVTTTLKRRDQSHIDPSSKRDPHLSTDLEGLAASTVSSECLKSPERSTHHLFTLLALRSVYHVALVNFCQNLLRTEAPNPMSKLSAKHKHLVFDQRRRMTTNTTADQAALFIQSAFESVKQVINPVGVPLTSLLVHTQGRTFLKTVVASAPPRNLTVQQRADATHQNGVPRVLLEASDAEADQLGGNTKFRIGSLTKLFLALIFCIVIETGVYDNLNWDTTILDWMKNLFGDPIPFFKSEAGAFRADLTIRDVLLHNGALPPRMNWFLFLLDGTFQVSDRDFLAYLENAANVSPGHHKSKGQYAYSNANYILLALLLEQQEGLSIDEIFQMRLLRPLGMNHTSLGDDGADEPSQDPSIPSVNYAKGQRLSSDSSTCTSTTIQQPYRNSTAYKMTVGTWSCVNDIAKMFEAIFHAEPDKEGYITSAISQAFLESWDFEREDKCEPAGVSLAGRLLSLKEQEDDPESLNSVVRQMASQDKNRHQSHVWKVSSQKSKLEDKPDLYCKGGTCNSYTSTVYFHPNTKTFAIALSNARGPVDVTAPVARYLVRVARAKKDGTGLDVYQMLFARKVATQRQLAAQVWSKIEAEDSDLISLSRSTGSLKPHSGVYRHNDHNLQIEITGDTAVYSRRRDGDRAEFLTTMRVRVSTSARGEVKQYLRPFSLQGGTFVDRLIEFCDPRLEVVSTTGRTTLVSNPEADTTTAVKEQYVKQEQQP